MAHQRRNDDIIWAGGNPYSLSRLLSNPSSFTVTIPVVRISTYDSFPFFSLFPTKSEMESLLPTECNERSYLLAERGDYLWTWWGHSKSEVSNGGNAWMEYEWSPNRCFYIDGLVLIPSEKHKYQTAIYRQQ